MRSDRVKAIITCSRRIEEAEDRLMDSINRLQCLTMTAENPTSGDLTPVPIVTCKLCLCEQPLDKVTMLQECQCIYCTSPAEAMKREFEVVYFNDS
ncbi:hypothetical protein STEG23_002651 [Scotinomys teguina]